MAFQKREKLDENKKKKKKILSKRACRFCIDSENVIDFKRPKLLADFVSDQCKITPRRMSGNCQFHQNRIVESVKRARHLALLPYTLQHVN